MNIPPYQDIITRAIEERADAVRAHDDTSVRQLDKCIVALTCGASLCWEGDGLHIGSVNHPGVIYIVREPNACPCPAFKPCYHLKLRDLLLDMHQTAADTADMEADMAEPDPPGDGPNPGDSEPGIGPPTEGDECPEQYRMTLSAYAVARLIIAPRRAHGARLAQARRASAYAM